MNIGQHLVKLRANDTFLSHSGLCCGTIILCHPVSNHWFQSISVYSTVHQKFCVPVYCTLTVVRQSSSNASTFDSVSVTVVTPLATRLISLQKHRSTYTKKPNVARTPSKKLHHAFFCTQFVTLCHMFNYRLRKSRHTRVNALPSLTQWLVTCCINRNSLNARTVTCLQNVKMHSHDVSSLSVWVLLWNVNHQRWEITGG